MRRSGLTSLLLCCALLSGGCAWGASPAATPTPVIAVVQPTTVQPTATTAPAQPTQAPTMVASTPTLAPARPTATSASAQPSPTAMSGQAGQTPVVTPPARTSFVVPTVAVVAVTPVPLPTRGTASKDDTSGIQQELQTFFETFYKARSLERGGKLEMWPYRGLVGGAYADYTIPLFNRDILDAQAGKLLEARYSNIKVKLEDWQPGEGGSGKAHASVTRTLTTVRSDRQDAPQTATYQFRLERLLVAGPENVAWMATDFLNPALNRWVSEPTTATTQQVTAESQRFFEEFYAARSVTRGGKLDLDKSMMLTQFSYQVYTLPLLEGQQKEVEQGKITAIAYRDIKTRLLNYDASATNHGGIATIEVTRTALVTRPAGAEPPQTGTYQFRLHRHIDDAGQPHWLAVDFLQPEAKRWVSEIAGMEVPVPPSGHG